MKVTALFSLALVISIAVFGTGCAPREHRVIGLPVADSDLDTRSLECWARFQGVVDDRRHDRLVGPSRHTYDVKNLIEYLDSRIVSAVGFSDAGRKLHVHLRYAYSQGKAMRSFYNIVFSVRLGEGPADIVRGRHDVTNWMGSAHEFENGLAAAADQAVLRMRDLLLDTEFCEQA